MQSRQALNGTFGLPALTERTLSEDDRQRVRGLYEPKLKLGRIEGRLIDNRTPGLLTPLNGVNVICIGTSPAPARDAGRVKFTMSKPGISGFGCTSRI